MPWASFITPFMQPSNYLLVFGKLYSFQMCRKTNWPDCTYNNDRCFLFFHLPKIICISTLSLLVHVNPLGDTSATFIYISFRWLIIFPTNTLFFSAKAWIQCKPGNVEASKTRKIRDQIAWTSLKGWFLINIYSEPLSSFYLNGLQIRRFLGVKLTALHKNLLSKTL